jgi:two-component system, NtrC family, sensor kinase
MRIPFFTLFCAFALTSSAQYVSMDNLYRQLAESKEDSNKVVLLNKIGRAYLYSRLDSCNYFASEGLRLAQKLGDLKGESTCLSLMASMLVFSGNYPEGLRLSLRALQIAEKLNDALAMMDAINAEGTVYYFQKDYKRAVWYFHECLRWSGSLKEKWIDERELANVGDAYLALNKLGSALYFTSIAYNASIVSNDTLEVSDELDNMGDVYAAQNKTRLAHQYYQQGMSMSLYSFYYDDYCVGALGAARLFLKEGIKDSALFYGYRSLDVATSAKLTPRQLEASNFIETIFEADGRQDSSFKYLKLEIVLQDSLYSQEKSRTIQNLTFEETLRQQDLAQQKKRWKKKP